MGEVCAVRGLPGCFEPPAVAFCTQWSCPMREISAKLGQPAINLYKPNFSQAKLTSGLGVASTPLLFFVLYLRVLFSLPRIYPYTFDSISRTFRAQCLLVLLVDLHKFQASWFQDLHLSRSITHH